DKSYLSSAGLARKSTNMVVMLVKEVTWQTSIRRAAASRSQRVMMTMVLPASIGVLTFACMPVTWNIGSVASATPCPVWPDHASWAAAVLITEWWVCMQPLGAPVVPEV